MKKEKRYYTKTELGIDAGISRQTLRKWEKNGKLVPFFDEHGKEYFLLSQIEDLNKQRFLKKDRVVNEDMWVDLKHIPKDNKGGYYWIEAVKRQSIVKYGRGKITGVIHIKGYDKHSRTLKVIVDDETEEKEIKANSLSKAMLKWLLGDYSKEYRYSIGERVIDGDTDITITKLTRSGKKNVKTYEFICNKCGQPGSITEGNISDKGSCSVCIGKHIVEGVNDIATTDKWMIPYFIDPAMASKYYHGNRTESIIFKCPDCGRVRNKPMYLDTLYRTKSIGCRCGDGFSYPNKFMFSICEQLLAYNKIHYFEDEFNAKWINKRRFDFYIEIDDKKNSIFVEMDGGFHSGKSRDKNVSPKELLKIDKWKDKKANENGIKVIRIKADVSEMDYLRREIENALYGIIDFMCVDWNAANEFAISNYTKTVCLYYESHKPISIEKLAEECHISKTTALRYVKRGEEVGWCSYDMELLNQNKYAYARLESEEKEKREKAVCEYYNEHAPIGAKEIAKIFKIHHATALKYLKNCEKYGYKPYDKNYTYEINIDNLKNTSKDSLKKVVLCYSKDHKLIKRYESVTEAAKDNDVSPTAISSCCKKLGTSAGKIFRYES